jgi:gamma-glutamylcyclotransferase (GGCT)/AIG2-like uncharacterized protein YtfP
MSAGEPMSHHLYAYGTLQIPAILAWIVGRELVGCPARLSGYARYRIKDRPYPAIVQASDAEVDGMLYRELDVAEMERLDSYEGHLYERRELLVRVEDVSIVAATYVLRPEHAHRLSPEPWDLARFERDHLASYLARIKLTSRAP